MATIHNTQFYTHTHSLTHWQVCTYLRGLASACLRCSSCGEDCKEETDAQSMAAASL